MAADRKLDKDASKGDHSERRTERKVTPPEERHKRGRWVLPLLLFISVAICLYFLYLS